MDKLLNTENRRNIIFDDKITIKSYLVTFTKNIRAPVIEQVVKPKKIKLIVEDDDNEHIEEVKKPNIVEEVIEPIAEVTE